MIQLSVKFSFSIFFLSLFSNQLLFAAKNSTPPNVLIIVSDDQGYNDLGCFGSNEVLTPHLDDLARGGIKLTSFYVTWPACTPSRGGFLSGRYPQRNGLYDMIRNEAPDFGHKYKPADYAATFERVGGMDTREILLPQMLKAKNYTNGIYGKWDLGVHKRFLPLAKGFDDFYGFSNTGIDYYTHERYGVPSMFRNNKPTEEDKGTYCTYLFQREAVKFLNKNHDKPFFLYVPFNAPHSASNLDPKIRTGAQAPEKYKKMYPKYKEEYVKKAKYRYAEKYPFAKNVEVSTKETRRLKYMASITCMDDAIGEMLDVLEKYKIADNTIVIFFSDNGGGGGSNNKPLKGGKTWMFEGGNRVPCIIRYPKKIPSGKTTEAFLTSLEIIPTLLKETGIAPPKDVVLDGYDMMPTLANGAASPRNEMYWQRRNDKATRVGNWKWVESAKGNGLFNLSKDIGEQNDLSISHPEKLKEMKTHFANWKKKMAAAEPRGPFRDY